MQTNISHIDPLSEIEHALKSQGITHAASLLKSYLENNSGAQIDNDRLLNLRLQILINQGRFEELDSLVSKSSSDDLIVQSRMAVAQGILSNRKGDFRNSLTSFLEAESLASQVNKPDLAAQVQINIGTVFASLHHYKEGSDRYHRALTNYSDVIAPRTKAVLLHNLGNLYYAHGEIDQSIESLKSAIVEADNEESSLQTTSKVLLERSRLKQSLTPNLDGLEVEESSDLYPVYRFCKSAILSDDDRIIDLPEVIGLAEKQGDFLTQIESRQILIQLQQSKGDLSGAIETMEGLRSVETKLRGIQEEARLLEQAAKYDLAEKEQAIKALEKENELQKEIVKRNEMLEVANEDLRQFAYVVSHDLKEPLRMIGSYSQLIQMELKKEISGDQIEYFDFVQGGVQRLNILLDGLSNYSTLKSLQESKTTISLSDIIRTASDNLDFLIHEQGAQINLTGDLEISGSRALLELLFQNLIQNAIKFKSDDDPIIEITHGQTKDGVFIEVHDNGIGIAEDQHQRVFVIFQRLSRKNNDGSGMGLAICKKIVQLHNGKILVKPSSGAQGTTFRVELDK